MNRRIAQEIGRQCLFLNTDGNVSLNVDNCNYRVHVRTITTLWNGLDSGVIRLNRKVPSKPNSVNYDEFSNFLNTDDTSEESGGYDCSFVLEELCRRFFIDLLRVNDDACQNLTLLKGSEEDLVLDHFLPIVCVIEIPAKRLCKIVYYEFLSTLCSLHSLSLYAHHNFSTHSQLFNLVVFQLIQLYLCVSSKNIFPIFSLRNILSNQNLWLFVEFDSLILNPNSYILTTAESEESTVNFDGDTHLWELTERWCCGEMSNLDYLLKLNDFAGRIRGDPSRHPIVPWVVDFSSADGGFRPLDRTKFRLAKGDAQLNEQFTTQHPAHHIPELLSDIGYMAYRARVEPKSELCKYVRSAWVPEEYPSTMARLYSWTPDECIPEFYEDPSIFISSHNDMSDLGIPEWTTTPAEFIQWHREKLECAEVSGKLHKWIDLAFGYLLSGSDAVDALNVHLSFVDRPSDTPLALRKHGAVRLFAKPHPRRLVLHTNANGDDSQPVVYGSPRKTGVTSGDEEELRSSSMRDRLDPKNIDFSLCDLWKGIHEFKSYVGGDAQCCLQSVGVTIVELVLAEYCRELSSGASFSNRLRRAQNLTQTKGFQMPRNILHTVRLLLGLDSTFDVDKMEVDNFLYSFQSFFLTPPSIALSYDLLREFYRLKHDVNIARTTDNVYNLNGFVRDQIAVLYQCFEYVELNELWLNLLIQMLECQRTAATVCYRLFGRAAECSNRSALDALIPVIRRLLQFVTPNTLTLLDRRFHLQLCVRFGTATYFRAFLTPLVEAVLITADSTHEVACESILWLSKRYGPFLTANYISSSLLCLLSVCYLEQANQLPDIEETSLDVSVEGDTPCGCVIDCLVEISSIYGTAFITLQYLPFCADTIDQAARRLTVSLESAIVSSMVFLQIICDSLSDKQLMDHLQDPIVDRIIFPAVRLFSSTNVHFSTERSRRLFVCKALRTLHLLAVRIGAENVQRYMAGAIQRIFCTFNLVYDQSGDEENEVHSPAERKRHSVVVGDLEVTVAENAPKQLIATFTPRFARFLIHVFSRICGRQFLFGSIPNAPLITRLAAQAASTPLNCVASDADEPRAMAFSPRTKSSSSRIGVEICPRGQRSPSSPNVVAASGGSTLSPIAVSSSASIVSGNRLSMLGTDEDMSLPGLLGFSASFVGADGGVPPTTAAQEISSSNFDPTSNFSLNKKMSEDTYYHLSGSWVDHLHSTLSATSPALKFNQIRLATFQGHAAAVRHLRTLDNENSFVSASVDRTLKLWSVRTTEQHSVCQWTYAKHARAVVDVALVEARGWVASSDGTVHIWDPFRGSTLQQFDWTKSASTTPGANASVGNGGEQFPIIALSTFDNRLLGAISSADSVIKTIDYRCAEWAHHLCVTAPLTSLGASVVATSSSSGTVVATAPLRVMSGLPSSGGGQMVAVASATGRVVVLDIRSGRMLSVFVLSNADITQLLWLDADTLAVVFAEHPVELWTNVGAHPRLERRLAETAAFACHLAETSPPASSSGRRHHHSHQQQYLSVQPALARLRFSDADAAAVDVKLRPDFIAGAVTAIAHLRLNRMLLFGSSTGMIRLAC